MDWQLTYQLDLMGSATTLEILSPHLAASDDGSIVFLGSTAAVETFIAPQPYNAAKAALITYAKQLCQPLGEQNIRVNVVSPGPIEFDGGNWQFIKEAMPDLYSATKSKMVFGQFGKTADVAKAIVLLASPASSYTIGINVVVDSGFTKRVQF